MTASVDRLASAAGRLWRARAAAERHRAATAGRDVDLAAAAALAAALPDDPELRGACLEQARLAERAAARGATPPGVADWLWTDAGLQQSSLPAVARHRAASLTQRHGGPGSVVDAGCGLGVDAWALTEAGWLVTGIEADPWVAAAARHNGAGGIDVRCARAEDALAPDAVGAWSAAFCDPARRVDAPAGGGGRTPPERDPQRWSPSWSWVVDLAGRIPTVAKAAPGIPLSVVPTEAEVEWLALGDQVVEATVWFAPLARTARRASVLADDGSIVAEIAATASDIATTATAATVPVPEAVLVEPHPAVLRAGLVDVLAGRLGLPRLSRRGHWLTGVDAGPTALARRWSVVEEVPASPRRMRAALAARSPASVTYKTADIGRGADDLAARVGVRLTRGGPHLTVAMVRIGDDVRAFVVALEA